MSVTTHPDEQARELARIAETWGWSEQLKLVVAALLAKTRLAALEEAELAFKAAYSEYEEPLIGVMWGLKAIASLRQAAGAGLHPKDCWCADCATRKIKAMGDKPAKLEQDSSWRDGWKWSCQHGNESSLHYTKLECGCELLVRAAAPSLPKVLTSSDVSTRTYFGPASTGLTPVGGEQAEIRPTSAALHKEGAGGELAWLIEKGGLCLGFCARKFTWLAFTDESALRFSRRSDAIRFIEAMRESMNLDDVLVTEHMWAASPAGRAENDTAVRSELLEETVELLEHENNKLWRISQAVKLQSDPAQLQQFYDYVKGVVESS